MTELDQICKAADEWLMNEQASPLRECRAALDDLLLHEPLLAAKVCGHDSLGNLRARLHEYRPRGIFHGHAAPEGDAA